MSWCTRRTNGPTMHLDLGEMPQGIAVAPEIAALTNW